MRPTTGSIFLGATAETVAFARIVVFGLWLAILLGESIEALARLPREFARMPGVLQLIPASVLDNLLSASGLATLRWTLLALLSLVVVGARPFRPLALAAAVLLVLYDGIVAAYGQFIAHSRFPLIYLAWILALGPSADAFSLGPSRRRRPRDHYIATMMTLAITLAMTYMFVGGRRFATGLDVCFGNALPTWLAVRSFEASAFGFELGPLTQDYPSIGKALKAGFLVVTAFEILSPVMLVSDVFRRLWIATIIPFHVSTLLTMNIFFWENVALIAFLFTGLAYRSGAAVRQGATDPPIVFFDGACAMCNGFVRWVIARDMCAQLRFAPLQGDTARQRIGAQATDPLEWSLVLLEGSLRHARSDAALRVLLYLGGAWGLLGSALLYVPGFIRDAAYRVVAHRRYAWFGSQVCAIGMHDLKGHILP